MGVVIFLLWLGLGEGLRAWKWNWSESPRSLGPPFTECCPGNVPKFIQWRCGTGEARAEGPCFPAMAPHWASSSVLWADRSAQVPTPLALTCPWPASEVGLMTKCDPAVKSIPNQLFSQPTHLPQRGVSNPYLWG